MEENKQIERRVIKISRTKLIVMSIVLFLIILFVGFVFLKSSSNFRISSSGPMDTVLPMSPNELIPYGGYNKQNEDSSISDTREFMKTSYNSTIKTRNAPRIIKEVKNIIKGADGRIDNMSSSEKYGYIRFVVAKSKFDAMKDEIESITHKKLYTENISSQNLLTEKQGIESQILDASTSLSSLISQRDILVSSHTKELSFLNKELSRINGDLVKVRANIALLKPNEINVSYSQQETSLVEQQTNQIQNINQENKNYLSKKQNLDNLINNASADLGNANKQDDKFTDNIETVNGYVSAEWVSLWEIAVIFSPIHPTWIIIILIILSFIILRKRMPKVEIV